MTPLDAAHAVMTAAPTDDRARLAFYDRLAGSELFLLLEREPVGDAADPVVFPAEEGRFVLAFDREERLADFAGRPAPYLAISGRALAALVAGEALGLGLNLGAPSEMLIDADGMEWLAATLSAVPDEVEARFEAFHRPSAVPEALLSALDARLASAEGRADHAWLADATFAGGVRAHLLAVVDPAPGAEGALAQAVGEALTFSGLEAGWLDVAFFRRSDPAVARIARVGLRFDLPKPSAPPERAAPGSDPDRPPRLR